MTASKSINVIGIEETYNRAVYEDFNKISTSGHKDTREGHEITEHALKNTIIRTTLLKMKPQWRTCGYYYSAPLWQVKAIALMCKGAFAHLVKDTTMEPLWFNMSRNLIKIIIEQENRRNKS